MEKAIPLKPDIVVKFDPNEKPIHRVSIPHKSKKPGRTIVHIAMEELKRGDMVYIVKVERTNDYIKYYYRKLIVISQDFQPGARIK